MKLEYFPIMGRGLMLRMIIQYTNANVEDSRVSMEQFGANKAAGKYPQG